MHNHDINIQQQPEGSEELPEESLSEMFIPR